MLTNAQHFYSTRLFFFRTLNVEVYSVIESECLYQVDFHLLSSSKKENFCDNYTEHNFGNFFDWSQLATSHDFYSMNLESSICDR